jgi:hypothetical protein
VPLLSFSGSQEKEMMHVILLLFSHAVVHYNPALPLKSRRVFPQILASAVMGGAPRT